MVTDKLTRRKVVAHCGAIGGVVLSGCLGGNDNGETTAEVFVNDGRESKETQRVERVLSALHGDIGNDLDTVESNMNEFTGVLGKSSSEFKPKVNTERLRGYENQLDSIRGKGTPKQQTMTEYVLRAVEVLKSVGELTPLVQEAISCITAFENGASRLDGDVCKKKADELSGYVESMYTLVNSVRASRGDIARGDVNVGEGLSYGVINGVVERIIEVVDYFGLIERGFTQLGKVVGEVDVLDSVAPSSDEEEVIDVLEDIEQSASKARMVYVEMDDFWDGNLEGDVLKLKCVSGVVRGMASSLINVVESKEGSGRVLRSYVMSVVDDVDDCNYEFVQKDMSLISRRYL